MVRERGLRNVYCLERLSASPTFVRSLTIRLTGSAFYMLAGFDGPVALNLTSSEFMLYLSIVANSDF